MKVFVNFATSLAYLYEGETTATERTGKLEQKKAEFKFSPRFRTVRIDMVCHLFGNVTTKVGDLGGGTVYADAGISARSWGKGGVMGVRVRMIS